MAVEDDIQAQQATQYGLITYDQLCELGLTRAAILHRVAIGRLRRIRAEVYVAPAVAESLEQCALAATMSAGVTAFASHATAARLWKLPAGGTLDSIEVTTVLERQPRVRGVRMHRSGLLVEGDMTWLGSIPISSVARTIVDLSGRLGASDLGRLVDEALRLRLTSLGAITHVAARLPRAPGRSPKRLRHVLDARTPGTESPLENFVVDSLARYELPSPTRQHPVVVGGRDRRIDLCYVDVRLALEAQGYEYHGQRSRFDEDTLRGNELLLAGFRVLEFTSAFDDFTIAKHVAIALGLRVPDVLRPRLTYEQWKAA